MREAAHRTLILTIGIVAAAVLIPGCQEEQLYDTKSAARKVKLVEAENRQLREDIERLKEQHKNETKQQEKLLNKCRREKEAVAKVSKKGIKALVDPVMKKAIEEIARVREVNESLRSHVQAFQKENDRLRREIERLEKEVQELRKKPSLPDKPQPL